MQILAEFFVFPQKHYGWFPESTPPPKKKNNNNNNPPLSNIPMIPPQNRFCTVSFQERKRKPTLPASIPFPVSFPNFRVDFESKERNSDEDGIQKNDGLEKKSRTSWKFQPWNDGKNSINFIPKTTHSCLTKWYFPMFLPWSCPKTRHPEVKFPMFV